MDDKEKENPSEKYGDIDKYFEDDESETIRIPPDYGNFGLQEEIVENIKSKRKGVKNILIDGLNDFDRRGHEGMPSYLTKTSAFLSHDLRSFIEDCKKISFKHNNRIYRIRSRAGATIIMTIAGACHLFDITKGELYHMAEARDLYRDLYSLSKLLNIPLAERYDEEKLTYSLDRYNLQHVTIYNVWWIDNVVAALVDCGFRKTDAYNLLMACAVASSQDYFKKVQVDKANELIEKMFLQIQPNAHVLHNIIFASYYAQMRTILELLKEKEAEIELIARKYKLDFYLTYKNINNFLRKIGKNTKAEKGEKLLAELKEMLGDKENDTV